MKKTSGVGPAEREFAIHEITYEPTESQWLMHYEPPRHQGREALGLYARRDAELTIRTWRTWADLERIEAQERRARVWRAALVVALGLLTLALIAMLWSRT